jgi:NADPH:quinone reductase-like Zn-dependent oxidoreductase
MQVGKNVKHLSVGQRVVPMTGIRSPALTGQGTWQEYIVVPATSAIPVPNSVSDEVASISQFFVNSWSVFANFPPS